MPAEHRVKLTPLLPLWLLSLSGVYSRGSAEWTRREPSIAKLCLSKALINGF